MGLFGPKPRATEYGVDVISLDQKFGDVIAIRPMLFEHWDKYMQHFDEIKKAFAPIPVVLLFPSTAIDLIRTVSESPATKSVTGET